MAYGRFRRAGKSARSSWGRRRTTRGTRYGVVRKSRFRSRRFAPRFATVGYARDVEKKYLDRALVGSGATGEVTGIGTGASDINNGFMWRSSSWKGYDFATDSDPGNSYSNDLLKHVGQGTTAKSRIGNKITAKYVKGAITLTASKLASPSQDTTNGDMNGEALATASDASYVYEYMRTTFRVVMVMDLQVNSTDEHIKWDDVFENDEATSGKFGGVHSELKVANMGRFRVMSDKVMTLDAKRPQETMRFMVNGNSIGTVRYNGASWNALTDKGLYVIWAAYTGGVVGTVQGPDSGVIRPGVTMHSRLCFTDA